jgi:glucose-6-phosphate isomerase
MITLKDKPSLAPNEIPALEKSWNAMLANPLSGFAHVAQDGEAWELIRSRSEQCGRVSKVIVVGIGGSSLGLRAIDEMLFSKKRGEVIFLESADPVT